MTTAAMRVSERVHPSTTFDAVIPFVGRVLLSAIFLASVVGKIQEPAGTIGYIASAGLPFPQLGYALAVLIELVGGLALLVGYRTRIAAGALALMGAFNFVGTIGSGWLTDRIDPRRLLLVYYGFRGVSLLFLSGNTMCWPTSFILPLAPPTRMFGTG